jgi:CubicO group peptidase (beta-lactamase class C family)
MKRPSLDGKLPLARLLAGAALLIGFLSLGDATLRAMAADQPRLPRSTPEAQGISSGAISQFLAGVATTHGDVLDSFMLIRHGHVVAEGWWAPYDAGTPHALYSGTKSFTSTAVGLAIAERRLRLDDRVLGFFPAEAPAEPGDHLRAMRVRDLLTMTTGHEAEPPFRGNPALSRSFLSAPVPHPPGTHFLYNTTATDMLGIIVEKVTGESLRQYLQPRLFGPLGITDLRWTNLPEGFNDGGIGLSLRTEDFARFGQLLLQKGRWQGRQVVPAEWIEAATSVQTATGTDPVSEAAPGYGFQFWRGRHNTYRADGAFGQFCLVLPDQDAVVAITSGIPLSQMQSMLNLVWEQLLPAMQPGPLPENDAGAAELARTLAQARRRPVADAAGLPAHFQAVGRTYTFNANPIQLTSLKVEADDRDSLSLTLRFNDGPAQRLVCGRGDWQKGRLAFSVFPEQPVAGSAGWVADDTLVTKLIFPETPFAITLTLRFSADELSVESDWNIALGPTKQPRFTGRWR